MDMAATNLEHDLASDAASAVIRIVEGRRMVVLAETLAILVAYHMAQSRAAGRSNADADDASRTLLDSVMDAARHYDSIGLIQRAQ